MKDCIFCKIIVGEIPCNKVYEDNNTLAFLDIKPVNQGHCLVIPKEHFEDILDTKEEHLKAIMITTKKVAKAVMEATKAQGFNIHINTKEAAGQVVNHTHFHIIPRFTNDGLKLWPQHSLEEKEMQEIAKKIKAAVI